MAEARDLLQYVAAPDPAVFDYIEQQQRPTTIIFENAIALPARHKLDAVIALSDVGFKPERQPSVVVQERQATGRACRK